MNPRKTMKIKYYSINNYNFVNKQADNDNQIVRNGLQKRLLNTFDDQMTQFLC